MNKKIMFAGAGLLAALWSVEALAANTTEGQTFLSAHVEPYYTVTIPVDKVIPYGATRTEIGSLVLTDALLEWNHGVQVEAFGHGALYNGTAKLPYVLSREEEPFSKVVFYSVGEAAPLTVDIAGEDWNQAAAGTYTDTITFRVSYVEK